MTLIRRRYNHSLQCLSLWLCASGRKNNNNNNNINNNGLTKKYTNNMKNWTYSHSN